MIKKELENSIEKASSRLDVILGKLDLAGKRGQIKLLETETNRSGFWQDQEKASQLLKKLDSLKEEVGEAEKLKEKLASLRELLKITKEDALADLDFITKELADFGKTLDKLELGTFLSGPYDTSDAILSIHAGQGGTEACDWVAMLKRMYLRYGERRGWKLELVEERPGEEAGIKSSTMFVRGRYAYGYLLGEKGTHRLVRLSPFNANNLRQTSFALVEVMPIFDENQKAIEINPKDIEIEFSRSSGHGGQNINKVSTAVRIRHIPTNIVVQCQTQRYQEQNRKIAMQILAGKLWQKKEQELASKKRQVKGEHKIAGWGNQIRSYVLHPYKLVKDLRTGWEETDASAVLDGQLDNFIRAQLSSLNLNHKKV